MFLVRRRHTVSRLTLVVVFTNIANTIQRRGPLGDLLNKNTLGLRP